MLIFLTHASEEAGVAKILKQWIEDTFLGHCNVFVSSDLGDVPAGERWIERLESALGQAKACLVLCSPLSLTRSWVHFEVGCAWARKIPIIPICHSGQPLKTLPSPLLDFQGTSVDAPEFTDFLLSAVGRHLEARRLPRIDRAAFVSEVGDAIRGITSPSPQGALGLSPTDDLRQQVLQMRTDFDQSFRDLRQMFETIIEAKKPSASLDVERLRRFEGVWNGMGRSTFCPRIVEGTLRVPYCYGSDDHLTGDIYDCAIVAETLFARFRWFDAPLVGSLFMRAAKDDQLLGGWWFDDDLPLGIREMAERIDEHLPGMNPLALVPAANRFAYPHWASMYFGNAMWRYGK